MFKTLATGFYLFLFSLQLFCQEYPVRIFTTNDGLSQMQVITVFKDSRGYIWAGTKFGISKYNGEKFTRFDPNPTIMGSEIHGIVEDWYGNLYCNGVSSITRFDGKEFKLIKKEKGLCDFIVSDLTKKEILVLKNKEIYKVEKNDTLIKVNWPALIGRKINFIFYDKFRKQLLAGLDSVGLVALNHNSYETIFRTTDPSFQYKNSKNGEGVISYKNKNGLHYVLINSQNEASKFITIQNGNIKIMESISSDFPFIFNDKAYILKAKTKLFQKLEQDLYLPIERPCYVENGFYLPSEQGLIFVATNGIKYFNKNQVPYCWSVSEDKFNRLWFWNFMFPTKRWDGNKLETVKNYLQQMQKSWSETFKKSPIKIDDNWYYGSIKDKNGNLWKSHGNGVLFYDYKKFRLINNPSVNDQISFSLLEDPSRNIVLSGGARMVHIIENKPPYKSTLLTEKNGMNVAAYILSMALEKPGVYWFGGGNILSRYDSDKKTWKEFTKINDVKKNLGIFDLVFDKKRTLWIASYRKGLIYYDVKKDSLIEVNSPELRSPVSFLGLLDNDHLLIGSLRQLFIMDLKVWYKQNKVVLKAFNNNNGFMGIESGQHGFFKDSKGMIYVTSGTVLSQIDPKKIPLNPDSLYTYFTKFNQSLIQFNTKNHQFKTNGDVRIEFESVGENRSFESQYAYKLDNEAWSPWQTEPVVTFSKLASGNYRLQVLSRTGNGDNSFSKPSSLNFSVSIMPWQSPKFPLYALIGLMSLGFAFYFYRQQQKKSENKVKRELANQEQRLILKDLEAREQNLKVQALQVQTAQAQMNPHFTFNTINAIQNLIFSDATSANENLTKFSKIMRIYLDASVDAKIDPQNKDFGMITFKDELDLIQLYCELEKLQHKNDFEFQIKVAPNIAPDYYKIPPLIIQPFVENAILHGVLPNKSKVGLVQVNFTLDADETLICQIIDDGIGRAESAKIKGVQASAHKSHGTDLVEKRVAILNQMGANISIETKDNEPSGTIVTIKHYI